jgi:inositol phosphorylceramide mannosyltransferase catalytic subunit
MGALSNNIMGGQPDHPWFHLLTENLIPYDWNWYFPYVIISWTSGQWFVTAMFEKYHALLQKDGTVRGFEDEGPRFSQLHHLLMSGKPNHDPWVFFTQVRGGTWSNWDSGFFPWLGDHLPRVILTGVGIGLVVILTCCLGCRWCCRRCNNRKSGYKQVPHAEEP